MKGFELVTRGRSRFHDLQALVEPASQQLGEKSGVAIRTKRVPVAKTITRQAFARDQQNLRCRHG